MPKWRNANVSRHYRESIERQVNYKCVHYPPFHIKLSLKCKNNLTH